jgi:integral membrane protein
MAQSSAHKLKTITFYEGISLLLLFFIAMPLKYLAGYPIATTIAGSIHGVLFLLFIYQLYVAHIHNNFTYRLSGFILLLSVVPFGSNYINRRLLPAYL